MDKVIRVLVVDDSALMREMLADMLATEPGIVVVGKARDGHDALKKVATLKPDVVTLDVLMPGMDGLQTLEALLALHPVPVIMVSALTHRAADVTLQALDRGAVDYVAKPDRAQDSRSPFRDELIHKVRTMAGADVTRLLRIRRARAQTPRVIPAVSQPFIETSDDVYQHCSVAIGISTGGPPALSALFQELTPPLPPIVVVQHMPPAFTSSFANRLNSISRLSIKEAETGDELQANHVLIAPGGAHMHLRRRGSRVVVEISEGDPVSGHRPSVDVMMHGVATAYRARCLGVIMTGMGHDGAAGCAAIRDAGGYVLGQDAATSDVYGMNRVAFVNGHVNRQFGLPELPQLIARQCAKLFAPKRDSVANTA